MRDVNGSMDENEEVRAIVKCSQFLPPPPSSLPSFPSQLEPLQGVAIEAMVAPVDSEVLHRRMDRVVPHRSGKEGTCHA